jgi:putative heme-binding domain-containing protein
MLPAEDVRPVLRAHWSDYGLRDAILLQLTDRPDAVDRDKFLFGLESSQPQVVRACLTALDKLPRDAEAKDLVPLLRLLRSLLPEAKERPLRRQVVALVERQTGQTFAVTEDGATVAALKKAYQPVFDWFEKQHPSLKAALNGDGAEDAAAWDKLLRSVDWDKGVAERGEALFRSRACMTCHTGSNRLGPDLAGVTTRMSRDDVLAAIIYPSRDVAPAYRVVTIETQKGQTYSGIVAFESADGVILQTGAATTVRIATPDVASRKPSNRSLMPDGLLKDLKAEELADLYRFLQTIKADKPSK